MFDDISLNESAYVTKTSSINSDFVDSVGLTFEYHQKIDERHTRMLSPPTQDRQLIRYPKKLLAEIINPKQIWMKKLSELEIELDNLHETGVSKAEWCYHEHPNEETLDNLLHYQALLMGWAPFEHDEAILFDHLLVELNTPHQRALIIAAKRLNEAAIAYEKNTAFTRSYIPALRDLYVDYASSFPLCADTAYLLFFDSLMRRDEFETRRYLHEVQKGNHPLHDVCEQQFLEIMKAPKKK